MGLETVNFLNDLVITNPVGGDQRSEGDNHIRNLKIGLKATFPGLAGVAWRIQNKSAGYTVAATDNMSVIRSTAAITLALTAAASLGNGFFFVVKNDSSGTLVLDPNSTETIAGASTMTLAVGQMALVWCDGVNWQAYVIPLLASILTNSLSGDVALNNIANYFDGPSVAQGIVGDWDVSGTVTVTTSAAAHSTSAKLWDGTTVIASAYMGLNTVAGQTFPISLSGHLATPAGNLRISVKSSNVADLLVYNASGNSKDCTITAKRVG